MITKKQNELINELYSKLEYIGAQKTWNNPVKDLFYAEKQDEKQHRKFSPDHIRHGMSINAAAKYFAVKHILDGLTSNLNVNDILHIRDECYYGQAIANEYRQQITEEITEDEIKAFESLDYAVMMEE